MEEGDYRFVRKSGPVTELEGLSIKSFYASGALDTGDLLLTLDAMKMEHRITATSPGTVASLPVAPGDVVREGDVLVELA